MSDQKIPEVLCGCGFGSQRQAGRRAYCVCPACGKKAPYQPGTPCRDMACPACGATMCREFPGAGPAR